MLKLYICYTFILTEFRHYVNRIKKIVNNFLRNYVTVSDRVWIKKHIQGGLEEDARWICSSLFTDRLLGSEKFLRNGIADQINGSIITEFTDIYHKVSAVSVAAVDTGNIFIVIMVLAVNTLDQLCS